MFFLPLSNTIITGFKDDTIFGWESDTLNCKYQLPVPPGKSPHYKAYAPTRYRHFKYIYMYSELSRNEEFTIQSMYTTVLKINNIDCNYIFNNDILQFIHLAIFSSPELKAQVSFSDCLSSVVCLSVCPSVLSVCMSVRLSVRL